MMVILRVQHLTFPQGITLGDGMLYVADVNNHAIRAIDLADETVTTIAGNGEMGRSIPPFGVVVDEPLDISIRSPWDVELDTDGRLHIAMAGTHQLWIMDLAANTLQASVGNGREAQLNLTLANSELAQPSGLFWHDDLLYFADSESSTIRLANFDSGMVSVISGTTDNSLFDFGDVDGVAGTSRLQHALGVTGTPNGDTIYIADTYNNKIKVYDPETDETTTLFGYGETGGFLDGNSDTAQFDEPGGLDYADGKVYVADTNNHAIRVIDIETMQVSTVNFPNPQALILEYEVVVIGGNSAFDDVLILDAQINNAESELAISINIPEGFKLNPLLESEFVVSDTSANISFDSETIAIDETTATIPFTLTEDNGELFADLTIFYCEADDEAFCLVDDVSIEANISLSDDAEDTTITIERDVIIPDVYTDGF